MLFNKEADITEGAIINALHVIKKVCEDNNDGNCHKCPFNVGHDTVLCGITDLEPHNWKIADYKKFQALL